MRARRSVATVAAAALFTLGLATASVPAFATGSVGTAIGFEDDDGNLAPDPTGINFDWNSFAPLTWVGTAPTRSADKTASGWTVKGLEDYQATTADTGFAGGTKQDDACPTVITAKADNKADLKRAYLAAKTGSNGHTYLMLSWVRIPQNTTSPSAHVAFEFNKSKISCGTSSGGLVERSAGDMLVVYDFEGGSTSNPTINLSRWITTNDSTLANGAGLCDISSDVAPCWNTHVALPVGTAEAKVNTGGSVTDGIAPTSETLGTNEFGEAGIDLTNAGVFTAGVCQSFGKAFGVSRTSGNSGTAQMKDLIGPGDFALSNCTSTTETTPKLSDGTTTVPSTGVSIGTAGSIQVKDSALVKVVGGSATPAGSVTFSLCKVDAPGTCGTGGTSIGTVNLTGTSYPVTVVSPAATVTSAGRYCWRGEFSGDSTNGISGSSDSTAGECFTVNPVTPGLSTTASADITLGGTISDTATLTGTANEPGTPVINPTTPGGAAAGTITFKLFGPGDCSTLAYTSAAVTVSGNGSYATPTPLFTPTKAGTYHWVAVYSGDLPNTKDVSANTDCSDTNEDVVVSTVASSLASAQTWVPNDSVTVSAPGGGNLNGTVSFALYASSDCGVSGKDAAIYSTTKDISGASPQTATSANTTAQTASGSFSWLVSYTSKNDAQRSIPANCLETSALTVTNGGTISSP